MKLLRASQPHLNWTIISACLVLIASLLAIGAKYESKMETNNIATNNLASDLQSRIRKLNPVIRQIRLAAQTGSPAYQDYQVLKLRMKDLRAAASRGDDAATRKKLPPIERLTSHIQAELTMIAASPPPVSNPNAKAAGPAVVSSSNGQYVIPILIYHHTSADFENQLLALRDKGYNTITMDDVVKIINSGKPLAHKSAVITIDDGFADQQTAFNLLKKYNMRATYYIITSGDPSEWCIGAARRYDQGHVCGDPYLNWDQLRTMDASGLISIGAHTVDHLNLPQYSMDIQSGEIKQSKATIEHELGHGITTFAYPVGGFNATTVDLVRQAGFTSAVSTIPGSVQSSSILFTLHRVRNAYDLP